LAAQSVFTKFGEFFLNSNQQPANVTEGQQLTLFYTLQNTSTQNISLSTPPGPQAFKATRKAGDQNDNLPSTANAIGIHWDSGFMLMPTETIGLQAIFNTPTDMLPPDQEADKDRGEWRVSIDPFSPGNVNHKWSKCST
jgi:hypothetical protein